MNNRSVALYGASAALAVPVMGPWLPLVAAVALGLHALFAIIAKYLQLPLREYLPMAGSPTGVERRIRAQRDEDKDSMARIKALEENAKAQGRNLNKVLRKVDRHIVGCESAASKNEADNAKIIATQRQHGQELSELTKNVSPMAEWHAARLKRAEFWARLADKATDKIIERVIWSVLVMMATAIGGIKIAPLLERLMGQ